MGKKSLNGQPEGFVERRQYARIETNLYITYSMKGSHQTEAGVFLTKNVSGGGILFESFKEIPIGTIVDLSIHLPTCRYALRAKGKVVRVEKTRNYGRYDIGLSLVEISDNDRRELIKYLVSIVFCSGDYATLFSEADQEASLNSIFEGARLT